MLTITAKYLWLDGCDPAELSSEKVEALLHDAVKAADFSLHYTHCSTYEGRTVALAVVGESHVVLTGDHDVKTMTMEVVSCTTKEAADAAVDSVRKAVRHDHASEQAVTYQVESGE